MHSDAPIWTGEQEQPSGETVDVEQAGTSHTLRTRKLCDVHETREVTRAYAEDAHRAEYGVRSD